MENSLPHEKVPHGKILPFNSLPRPPPPPGKIPAEKVCIFSNNQCSMLTIGKVHNLQSIPRGPWVMKLSSPDIGIKFFDCSQENGCL